MKKVVIIIAIWLIPLLFISLVPAKYYIGHDLNCATYQTAEGCPKKFETKAPLFSHQFYKKIYVQDLQPEQVKNYWFRIIGFWILLAIAFLVTIRVIRPRKKQN